MKHYKLFSAIRNFLPNNATPIHTAILRVAQDEQEEGAIRSFSDRSEIEKRFLWWIQTMHTNSALSGLK